MMHRLGYRRGFTAIELMVVIGIMILMVSLAVPSMAESLQRTKVGNAAQAINEAHNQARFLAKTEGPADPLQPVLNQSHYGVALYADHVEVTYGGSTLLDDGSKAIVSIPFRSDVAAVYSTDTTPPYTWSNIPGAGIKWEYQFGTGFPIVQGAHSYTVPGSINDAANIGVVSVGSPASPFTALRVRTVDGTADGRHHAAIRIFKSGLCHVELE
jgi:type II secretory pathway pseudopilin PulG